MSRFIRRMRGMFPVIKFSRSPLKCFYMCAISILINERISSIFFSSDHVIDDYKLIDPANRCARARSAALSSLGLGGAVWSHLINPSDI